jgi:hypothetical protein
MDLHIHTCLSPCGESESVPTRIVQLALDAGVDALAVCDHNASENVVPVRKAAEGKDLTVFGGMEITSQEEVHILGIFDEAGSLEKMQELVYANLAGRNNKEVFGPQYIVEEEDYVEGYNEHLLIGATDLSVDAVISAVRDFGGLVIASHIDREAFGLISQLGFVPEGLDLDAVELSKNYKKSAYSLEGIGYPFVIFSDAHHPEDIGTATTVFVLEQPTVAELRMACAGVKGRGIEPKAA